MNTRMGWVLGLLVALIIWSLTAFLDTGGSEAHAVSASQGALVGEGSPGRDASAPVLAPAISASESREPASPAASQAQAGASVDHDPEEDPLDAWFERLRELARAPAFHEPAFVLVQQMAGLARAGQVAVGRIRTAVNDEAESKLVRSACLLTLALAVPEAELRPLVLDIRDRYSDELERAAWLALALGARGEAGLVLRPADFKSMTEHSTFPVEIRRMVDAEALAQAMARLGQHVPGDYDEPRASARPDVKAERFTRELVICSILGPHTSSAGPVRDQLFVWAVARENPGRLMRDVSTWCLALASAEDEACAQQLLDRARQAGGYLGLCMLQRLAYEGGREDLVLAAVQEILLTGDPDYAQGSLITVEGLHVLTAVLMSENDDLRFEATQFAVDRIMDETLTDFDRSLYLNRLAAAGSSVLLDVASLAYATAGESRLRDHIILYLGRTSPGQKDAARDFLIQNYSSQIPVSARLATLRSLAEIGGPQSLAFLAQVAQTGEPEEIRARAQALLDGA